MSKPAKAPPVSNGELEHHFHSKFADVRANSDNFLYVADNFNHYADLENYCDDIRDSKQPLLLLGEKGVGKSALLANWILRRRRNKRTNQLLATASTHEFIFWHSVGVTRNSARVDVMMRRLMIDLKAKFDLNREVPLKNERLSWDLPRFIDQAAKKGTLIIVIDGINLLTSQDGSEVGLTWLPLEFPSNVRFILSVSTHIPLPDTLATQDILSEEMIFPRRPRFINELNRRQWHVLRLKPFDPSLSRTIVQQYVSKSLHTQPGSVVKSNSFITSLPAEDTPEALPGAIGLLLFQSQVEDIVRHKASSTPQYLRLLLQAVHQAVDCGFSLWNILEAWLLAPSHTEMLRLVLHSFEEGHICDATVKRSAQQRSSRAGGITALRLLYPHHPNLFTDGKISSSHGNSLLNVLTEGELAARGSGTLQTVAPQSMLGSLGDPHWIATFDEVKIKLQNSFSGFQSSIEKAGMGSLKDMKRLSIRGLTEKEVAGFGGAISADPSDMFVASAGRAMQADGFELNSVSHLNEAPAALVDDQSSVRKVPNAKGILVKRMSLLHLQEYDSDSEPEEAAKLMPKYLMGGNSVQGLGSTLGNALALLYTSYCGLTENELWNLLLNLEKKETDASRSPDITIVESSLIMSCYTIRGSLEDTWRTTDIHKTGIISRQQFDAGFLKVNPTLTEDGIHCLLKLSGSSNSNRGNRIDYKRFLKSIVDLDRRLKHKENSSRLAPLQVEEISDGPPFVQGDDESYASLGPLIEGSLLSVLQCVGVLRSTDFGVLVLPLNEENLREVVLQEFVIPRGGLEYWHNVLSSYFLRLPSNLRRSEELPWHLEFTLKWVTLRDMLADLRTFEIMLHSDLINDLLRYWRLLTQGPLYTRQVPDKDRKLNDQTKLEHFRSPPKQTEISLRPSDSSVKRQMQDEKVLYFGFSAYTARRNYFLR